ncbi:MAG: hypothetical protein B7C24_14670 [Bacteroidetes bacterium 4572_77]|nr:MAG: hypothetical protein B7C24_14670 [Bacteroidetes bacterium 4572_77]
MAFNWRKYNRMIHRDFGFFFFGMTIIYALSGIAINHIGDWNPSYNIERSFYDISSPQQFNYADKAKVLELLEMVDEEGSYKKHYYPRPELLKVFLKKGSLIMNTRTGDVSVEKLSRRPIFFYMNYLHYNPGSWWVWFSDIFAGALIILAMSGIIMNKGKKGIKGRGGVYLALGIIIPLVFLIFFR